jgi:hypothetical protein
MNVSIVCDYGADWAALYVDGFHTSEGHIDSINQEALELLNVDQYVYNLKLDTPKSNHFPHNLEDLLGGEE